MAVHVCVHGYVRAHSSQHLRVFMAAADLHLFKCNWMTHTHAYVRAFMCFSDFVVSATRLFVIHFNFSFRLRGNGSVLLFPAHWVRCYWGSTSSNNNNANKNCAFVNMKEWRYCHVFLKHLIEFVLEKNWKKKINRKNTKKKKKGSCEEWVSSEAALYRCEGVCLLQFCHTFLAANIINGD